MMKMMIGVLLLLFVSATYVGAQQCPSVEKILSVPKYAQETVNWCWVASSEMIMDFWKIREKQCVQVTDRYRNNLSSANPPIRSCCDNENKYSPECYKGGSPAFKNYSFHVEKSNNRQGIDWATLTNEIDHGRPVDAGVTLAGDGNHFFVVSGYRIDDGCGRWVKVIDPCGSNVEETGDCKADLYDLSIDEFSGKLIGRIKEHFEDFINIFPVP